MCKIVRIQYIIMQVWLVVTAFWMASLSLSPSVWQSLRSAPSRRAPLLVIVIEIGKEWFSISVADPHSCKDSSCLHAHIDSSANAAKNSNPALLVVESLVVQWPLGALGHTFLSFGSRNFVFPDSEQSPASLLYEQFTY